MDIASIIGFVSGFAFIIISMLIAGDFDPAAVTAFGDAPSVMITIGGTLAALCVSLPLPKVLGGLKAIKFVFMPPKFDQVEAINRIVTLSNLARREGVLALEGPAQDMDDPFLKKGVMLVVDGADPDLVRSVLETEMAFVEARHKEVIGVWDMMSALGPAWGMIGTMVGLVLMMENIEDIALLAANMAVAMLTTFYGAIVANFFTMPIAKKLSVWNSEEMILKEVLIEGILSIQAGENPRIIEEKLKAFLAPSLRESGGGAD